MRAAVWVLLALVCCVVAHEQCGHDHVMEQYLSIGNNREIHNQFRAAVAEEMRTRGLFPRATTLLKIPVVWHVLYDPAIPETYLSKAQIDREMGYLNDWYSAKNRYYTTADYFSSRVASASDLNIQFYLAARDPNNNAFSGIHYIQSTLAGSGCPIGSTDMFYTSKGGLDNWPPEDYFNIYSCGIPGSTSGFAYAPDGDRVLDNMVIDYPAVGDSVNDLGSTLAHEAGHWLGLPHTFFGDSCSKDDNLVINDTPLTDIHGLNYIPNLRSSNPNICDPSFNMASVTRCGSEAVMYTNVMDYGYYDCKKYFTKGQASEMRGYLESSTSRRRFLPYSHALPPPCSTYDCFNKTCGSNGCGGTCGVCGAYSDCVNSQCISTIPSNSWCTSAQDFPQSTNGYTITQNNNGLNSGWTVGSCGGSSHTGDSVWYRLVSQGTGTASVTVTASDMASYVDIYRSTSCSSFSCAGPSSSDSLSFSVTAGQTYYIVVSGKSNVRGNLRTTLTVSGTGFTCGPNCGTTVSPSPSPSPSRTVTPTRTRTPTNSVPASPAASPSGSPSRTPTPTRTPTSTKSVSSQASQSAGASPSATPSRTRTPTPSPIPVTPTPTPSRTRTPSASRTPTPSPPAAAASSSPTPTRTRTRTPSPSAACDILAQCSASGFECGIARTNCGPNTDCGVCSIPQGRTCDINNKCVCPVGTTADATGKCVAPSNNNYQQLIPTGSTARYQISGNAITTTISTEVLLSWVDSRDLLSDYTSVETFELKGSSGTFTVAHRQGQTSGTNDRFGWEIQLTGSSATIRFCMWYYGSMNCASPGTYPFPTSTGMEVQHVMTLDDASNNLRSYLVWRPTAGSYYYLWGYLSRTYYPQAGALAYGITGPITLSDIKLSTTQAIEISLSDCISDDEWDRLFFALSLASQATTQWEIIRNNNNVNCAKAAGHGKAMLGSFTVLITSVGAPASAIVESFLTAAETANTAISSVAVLPGTEAALAMGIPVTSSASGPAFAGVIPGTAAAGGGGGAAGGLSGGAIAGIVIGSVAGGVLLLGLTAIVVAAVIVGAVLLTRSSDDDEGPSRSEGGQRRSVRRTIMGLFGGVDVMNDPGKGHQSITGRAPPMKA